MKLQQLIDENELELTINDVKSFFLGAHLGKKPLSFDKATTELLNGDEDLVSEFTPHLKSIWNEVEKNKKEVFKQILPTGSNTITFLTNTKNTLDYFLTALSLAGTSSESAQSETLAELIDELEDFILDLDEFLVEENPSTTDANELKEFAMEIWEELSNEF